jgi:glycosyltransferase involved in cell wall biosynthesis
LLVDKNINWDLFIIGDGVDRQSLEVQVSNLGLKNRIFMPGRAGNLGDWYKRADLYVLSSTFEGFPNTLMEAMSYGLPSVSYDCNTGPSELIIDGVNGYLVPPESGSSGLSKKMEKLMKNKTMRQTMGIQAAYVRDKYSIDQIDSKWNSLPGFRSE